MDDFKLGTHHVNTIARSIHEQLQEHQEAEAQSIAQEDTTEHGNLDERGEEWWNTWRKRIRTEEGYVRVGEDEDGEADDEGTGGKRARKRKKLRRGVQVKEVMGEVPMELEELRPKEPPVYDEELRILIKVSGSYRKRGFDSPSCSLISWSGR